MFETERLILKPYEDDDQEVMLSLFGNAEIKQTYMIPDFESAEQAIGLFKRMQALTQREDRIDCGIYLEKRLIGFVNVVQEEEEKIEVGYVIDPQFKNQGYATEALKALMQELFKMGYKEVTAGAFEDNLASRRVMEKCGMSLVDFEEEIEYRGKVHRCVYYSCVAES